MASRLAGSGHAVGVASLAGGSLAETPDGLILRSDVELGDDDLHAVVDSADMRSDETVGFVPVWCCG
jgi:hypothetical protein